MYIFLLLKLQDFMAPVQDLFHLNLCELAITLAKSALLSYKCQTSTSGGYALKGGVTCKYKANIVNYCQQLQ